MEGRTAEIIGRNMKKFREKQGVTQKDFSGFLGMNYYNYGKMEQGKYTPSLKKCLEICQLLGIRPEELFCEMDYETELRKFIKMLFDNEVENCRTGRSMAWAVVLFCEWTGLISTECRDALKKEYDL